MDADQNSIYSKASRTNVSFREDKEKKQRIFDVYMKAPYRLMDASRQQRQINRQKMRHMQFI